MAHRTGNVLNPARRMIVRLSLATGATVSAVLGAQTLALLDQRPPTNSANSVTISTNNGPLSAQLNATTTAIAVTPTVADKVITVTQPAAAPLIIIIRKPGVATAVKYATSTSPVNKPGRATIVPLAAKIVPPNPVIVQAPISSGGGGGSSRPAAQPAPVTAPTRK